VRLLVACALADILRIFAPEPPYEEETNADVIKLFIKILRGFQSPEMTPQHPSYRFVRGCAACLTSLLPLLMTSFVTYRFPLVASAVGLQPTLTVYAYFYTQHPLLLAGTAEQHLNLQHHL
jgi:hypothetical protein